MNGTYVKPTANPVSFRSALFKSKVVIERATATVALRKAVTAPESEQITLSDVQQSVNAAIRADKRFAPVKPKGSDYFNYPWVRDIICPTSDGGNWTAVVQLPYDGSKDGELVKIGFTIDASGDVALDSGEATPTEMIYKSANFRSAFIFGREQIALSKAVWTAAYINNLPDSAFLYIEAGGKKKDGKTEPRSLRHFPVCDASGSVDLPHLRNALARIPQAKISDDAKKSASAEARKLLEAETGKIKKSVDSDPKPAPARTTSLTSFTIAKGNSGHAGRPGGGSRSQSVSIGKMTAKKPRFRIGQKVTTAEGDTGTVTGHTMKDGQHHVEMRTGPGTHMTAPEANCTLSKSCVW